MPMTTSNDQCEKKKPQSGKEWILSERRFSIKTGSEEGVPKGKGFAVSKTLRSARGRALEFQVLDRKVESGGEAGFNYSKGLLRNSGVFEYLSENDGHSEWEIFQIKGGPGARGESEEKDLGGSSAFSKGEKRF